MNLRDYLYFNNLQIQEFAEKLMIVPSYLSDISRGMKKPSLRLAKSIETLTKGKVTVDDMMNIKPLKKKTVTRKKTNGKD